MRGSERNRLYAIQNFRQVVGDARERVELPAGNEMGTQDGRDYAPGLREMELAHPLLKLVSPGGVAKALLFDELVIARDCFSKLSHALNSEVFSMACRATISEEI